MKQHKLTNVVPHEDFQACVNDTINELAEFISASFGPYGSTSLLSYGNSHTFTKDGHTILKHVRYHGPMEHTIHTVVQEVAMRIVKKVGDGSTSSIMVANEILKELIKQPHLYNMRPVERMRLFNTITHVIKEEIFKARTMIDTEDSDMAYASVMNIATIALNNDKELAKHVADAYAAIQYKGKVSFKKGRSENFEIVNQEGLVIDSGYVDTSLINTDKATVEFDNPLIVMFDGTITGTVYVEALETLIHLAHYECKPLVIMAPDFGFDALNVLRTIYAYINSNKVSYVNVVQVPNGVEHTFNLFEDYAVALGAKPIRISAGEMNFMKDFILEIPNTPGRLNVESSRYGRASLVTSTDDYTTFLTPSGIGTEDFKRRVSYIELTIENKKKNLESSAIDVSQHEQRLAKLTNRHATLYVGGRTEAEMDANMYLVEDAIYAVSSALEHGYIQGSNTAVLNVYQNTLARLKYHLQKENRKEFVITTDMLKIIRTAYVNILQKLLNSAPVEHDLETILKGIERDDMAFDIINGELSPSIINSALTDITILEGALSIINILTSTNQFILHTPTENVYAMERSLNTNK